MIPDNNDIDNFEENDHQHNNDVSVATDQEPVEQPEKRASFIGRIKQRPFFRIILNKWILSTIIFLLLIFFGPGNGFISWIKAAVQLKKQEYVMEQYKEEIEKRVELKHNLTTNKDSLEKYARENYFFREEGEEVFILE